MQPVDLSVKSALMIASVLHGIFVAQGVVGVERIIMIQFTAMMRARYQLFCIAIV
jgi:hypothetical protein